MSDLLAFFFLLGFCISLLFFLFLFNRFGISGVDHALNAGVDLEIPGVDKWRTVTYVNRSIEARKVTVSTIKQRAKKILELVKKCAQSAPEVSVLIFFLTSLIIQLFLCCRYWMVMA